MRRKRKQTYIKPKPVLIALLVIVVAAGLCFSPLTVIRHVRVEGALIGDQDRLREIVASLKGVPCIQVDPRGVESMALAQSDIKSAELSRNPFGSALLKVTYREPAARLFGSPNILLSKEGVLYPSEQDPTDLPIVQLLRGGPPTLGTFAATWQPNLVAKLAIEGRKIFPAGEVRIQEERGGVMWLNGGSGRVILGSLADLDKKLNILRKRMVDYPDELSENEALDLTKPENPALKAKATFVNPFATRFQTQAWIWPVSIVCLILGFMIKMAWPATESTGSRLPFMQSDQPPKTNAATVDTQAFLQLSSEVSKLRQEKTELENAIAKRGEESSILNKSLQELKIFAGMTKVEGPGVVITLKDSAKDDVQLNDAGAPLGDFVIHDEDVLKTVNELFSAGAEAVSVNQHRVGAGTSFRCVGPVILVNDVKIAPPVVIRAIGDADTLYGGMTIPGGVLTMIRQLEPGMVKIEKVEKQELPGFVGKTSTQFVTVPEEKPEARKAR